MRLNFDFLESFSRFVIAEEGNYGFREGEVEIFLDGGVGWVVDELGGHLQC